MKILKLKFKNINSLSGENEIDFTNSVFTNNGLFAITGKTGSGKSSILDAISLALYGRTPRVKVSATENAVMTKGEKDCYAEIIFEVGGKKWKSSWKQELTKTGNLKPVNRIIADAADKIVADQVTSCDNQIVEIIGLKFDQFTKVILLAQGNFAAFLEAEKDEKGQILEQITGVEIYTEISKMVHSRSNSESKKLEIIKKEFELLKLLSDEEVTILNNEIKLLETEKKENDLKLQNLEAAVSWLKEIETLINNINEINDLLPELEEKAKETKTTLKNSEKALLEFKNDLKIQSPVFTKTRELDTKISEKENSLIPILKSISDNEKKNIELSNKTEKQRNELSNSKDLLFQKNNWIAENKKYEALVSKYTAIEIEKRQLDEVLIEINSKENNINDIKAELNNLIEQETTAINSFNENNSELTEKSELLEIKNLELKEILNGEKLSEIQSKKEKLTRLISLLKNLIELETSIFSNKEKIKNFTDQIFQFEKDKEGLSKNISDLKILNSELENNISLLEENLFLAKTILSLEDHRKNLKDNEECPLCGSMEHPFAFGNIPKFDEKENKLLEFRNKLKEKSSQLKKEELQLATLVSNANNAKLNKEKEEINLSDNTKKQEQVLSEIKNTNSDFSLLAEEKILQELLLEKQREEKSFISILENADACQDNLKTLRDEDIPELQKVKSQLEKKKNDAQLAKKLAEEKFNNKQIEINDLKEKYSAKNITFLETLEYYKVDSIIALENRLEEWKDNQTQLESLKSAISENERNIGLNEKDLENNLALLDQKQQEKKNIETEKQQLYNERIAIFSDKSVEEEEIRLNNLIKATEEEKIKAEKENTHCNMELEKNQAIKTRFTNEIEEKIAQNKTEQSLESLEIELNDIKKRKESCLQKIGANKKELSLNENNLKISGEKLKEKEQQEAICNNWISLNKLIGSPDGKTYRNFAQALTFEHLIGYTNIQLNKMTNRYILKRKDMNDYSNPFELSVIDKFHNGEERTTKNICGGEKFIISLSLALGLANMVSKKMSIDTMFIDEGFGTLDTDSLDAALNALSNLQSEGKVIGIISHITELKERIATHIEVIPGGNGHSRIQITN